MPKTIKPAELSETAGKKATKNTPPGHVITCRICNTGYDKGVPSDRAADALFVCDSCGSERGYE